MSFVESGKQPVARDSLATGCLPLSTKPAKPSQPIGNPLSNVLLFQTISMWCVIIGTKCKQKHMLHVLCYNRNNPLALVFSWLQNPRASPRVLSEPTKPSGSVIVP